MRFPGEETNAALDHLLLTVTAKSANSKARVAKSLFNLRLFVKPQLVYFFVTSVEVALLPKRSDPARQPICSRVLINFDQNRPVFSFAMLLTRAPSAAGFGDIEDEDT